MKIHQVIKIGGSLLVEPEAMRLIHDWLLATREESTNRVLIAGGGPVVEGLRRIDASNALSNQASHEAAIRLMEVNTRLLADWLPWVEVVESLVLTTPGDKAFACHAWLSEIEPRLPGECLAVGWRTTSDSIAARVAGVVGARLTLLKHSLAANCGSPQVAAAAGIVDAEFPRQLAREADFDLLGVINPGLPAAP